jgi:hypothetical protein
MSKKGVAKVKIETRRRRKPTKKRTTKSPDAPVATTSTDTQVLSPQ